MTTTIPAYELFDKLSIQFEQVDYETRGNMNKSVRNLYWHINYNGYNYSHPADNRLLQHRNIEHVPHEPVESVYYMAGTQVRLTICPGILRPGMAKGGSIPKPPPLESKFLENPYS